MLRIEKCSPFKKNLLALIYFLLILGFVPVSDFSVLWFHCRVPIQHPQLDKQTASHERYVV